mmetsp:Transcript_99202/g.248745  ORF Transcript_99202/g.248745 Transcript_99202/m.248745 type:complete len:404 (+) Transcript_99202:511-1722(+)
MAGLCSWTSPPLIISIGPPFGGGGGGFARWSLRSFLRSRDRPPAGGGGGGTCRFCGSVSDAPCATKASLACTDDGFSRLSGGGGNGNILPDAPSSAERLLACEDDDPRDSAGVPLGGGKTKGGVLPGLPLDDLLACGDEDSRGRGGGGNCLRFCLGGNGGGGNAGAGLEGLGLTYCGSSSSGSSKSSGSSSSTVSLTLTLLCSSVFFSCSFSSATEPGISASNVESKPCGDVGGSSPFLASAKISPPVLMFDMMPSGDLGGASMFLASAKISIGDLESNEFSLVHRSAHVWKSSSLPSLPDVASFKFFNISAILRVSPGFLASTTVKNSHANAMASGTIIHAFMNIASALTSQWSASLGRTLARKDTDNTMHPDNQMPAIAKIRISSICLFRSCHSCLRGSSS